MTTAPPPDLKKLDSARKHRRESRRGIVLPVLLTGLLLIVLTLLVVFVLFPATSGMSGTQATIVSNIMLVCAALCPVVLCLFLIYAMLVATLYYTGQANKATARRLRQTQLVTRTINEKTRENVDKASGWSVRFNATFAHLNPILNWFDRPGDQQTKGNDPNERQSDDD